MDPTGPASSKRRYWTEFDASGERLVLPIRLAWWVLAFGALIGVVIVAIHLPQWRNARDPVELLGAAFEVFAVVLVAFSLVATLFAEEFVEVGCGRLLHGWRLFGFRRHKSYDVRLIRGLGTVYESFSKPRERQSELVLPRRDIGKRGAFKFDYENESIYIGLTLPDELADELIAWLARRLPMGATDY